MQLFHKVFNKLVISFQLIKLRLKRLILLNAPEVSNFIFWIIILQVIVVKARNINTNVNLF